MAFDFSKLWIPIVDPKGLDSVVSEHFGRTSNHLILDVGSSSFEVIETRGDCITESNGNCISVDRVVEYGVSMIACNRMGKDALSRMNVRGIRVYSACSMTVRGVLEQYKAGGLNLISQQQLCQGNFDE